MLLPSKASTQGASATRIAIATLLIAACGREVAEAPREPGSPGSAPAPASAVHCLVTADAMGPVRLGMTLDEARRAFTAATFTRSSDGEGVALVSVALGDSSLLSLHAGEDDAEAPIDWTRPISFIETFSPRCGTAEGARPGALVADLERTLGSVRRIVLSEIESRQFIEFERQPAGVVFRLDYTGRFAPGARETTEYEPGASLFSIALTGAR